MALGAGHLEGVGTGASAARYQGSRGCRGGNMREICGRGPCVRSQVLQRALSRKGGLYWRNCQQHYGVIPCGLEGSRRQ
jgi:hypothetical protein